MTSQPRFFRTSVFGETVLGGNPATVVWNSQGLSDEIAQSFATLFDTSETVFIDVVDGGALSLRFFTPATEVFSCAHATLAAAHIAHRFIPLRSGAIEFHGRKNTIRVTKPLLGANSYELTAPPPRLLTTQTVGPTLDVAMNTNGALVGAPAYIISLGDGPPRVLIETRNTALLTALKVNFSALNDYLNSRRLHGAFFFAKSEDDASDYDGRFFAPNLGIMEDPVNGNSAACLSAIIGKTNEEQGGLVTKTFRIRQGATLEKPGTVLLRAQYVGGRVQKVFIGGEVRDICEHSLNADVLRGPLSLPYHDFHAPTGRTRRQNRETPR